MLVTASDMDAARMALHHLVDELPPELLATAAEYLAALRMAPGHAAGAALRPELRAVLEASWAEHADAYRYLAEH